MESNAEEFLIHSLRKKLGTAPTPPTSCAPRSPPCLAGREHRPIPDPGGHAGPPTTRPDRLLSPKRAQWSPRRQAPGHHRPPAGTADPRRRRQRGGSAHRRSNACDDIGPEVGPGDRRDGNPAAEQGTDPGVTQAQALGHPVPSSGAQGKGEQDGKALEQLSWYRFDGLDGPGFLQAPLGPPNCHI